ncbi:MAG: hypothetical protein MW689_001426 [Thermodesulfobacteria bacterium]|nr:PEP-CTERM sorting domain-containing protein [Thermodesulfobacteriota bacterium]MCU4137855.1 hypothetical protein [Thermodesulfobacteriota bacterium]
MKKIFFLLLIFLCLWAVNLFAFIVSWDGSIEKTSEPSDLSLGAYESSEYIRVFDEKQNYVLEEDLYVDLFVTTGGIFDSEDDLTFGTIPAGTHINSHLVHFDPIGYNTTILEGSITFDQKIIGVILKLNSLQNSDFLGFADTFDNGSLRGLEWGYDSFVISDDLKTLSMHLHTNVHLDNIRILTEVPIPSTLLLLGSGLFGLVGMRKRFKK